MSSKTNININIGALRQESQAITQGAVAKPARAHQSCEVAARLEAPPDTEGGRLVLQATALFDGPHTRAGHTDAYAVRPEQVKACLENLNKGAGFAPGSVPCVPRSHPRDSAALAVVRTVRSMMFSLWGSG